MIPDKILTKEEKLDAIYEMTLENHDMIKSIRRQTYFSSAFRIFYWLIILGAIGGAYIYVRPLIEVFTNNTAEIESSYAQFKSLMPESQMMSQFMEAYQKMKPEQ